ncbi:outer membrane beta-barrel protein [Ferruginibacter yonginensis]|uniref:Outer membrane beta-barrel protein n=1 Tax=Ferruginibacter yonginensis TaxID=1310416 RepID=A0ABV8QUT9_9BACT
MIKNFIGAIVLLLVTGTSFAQTGGLKGSVVDRTDSKPVVGATVSLLKQLDSSLVQKTITTNEGTFSFNGLMADSFIVKINGLNYQEYVSFITLKDTVRSLATVNLDRQDKDLSAVTVVSRTPPVVQKGDTSQFSASQYKVNPDASTEDLLKKMPSITVAKDGTVTAQGEQVKKVTIDGKDFFGDDASAALRNLPSEVVDKIQVFDRLSDQARLTGVDDGNSVKSINVVTKAGLKNGRFGRVYAGYGTDERYSAGGNASFFKGNRRISIVGNFNNINQQNFGSQDLLGITSSNNNNNRGGGGFRGGNGGGDFNVGQSNGISKTNAFGINYSNQFSKRATLTGSYFFNSSINNNQSIVNTETFLRPDTSLFSLQNSSTYTKNINQRINFRYELNIDSSNSLSIIPSFNFQTNNSVSLNDLKSFYGGVGNSKASFDTANTSLGKNNADRNGYNIRNTIQYRHAFDKKGKSISVSLNTNFNKNNSESITDVNYRYFRNFVVTDSTQNQFYDNVSNGYTLSANIAYIQPISKKSQLQFEYNPSYQKNKADQQTFSFDGAKYSQFDTLFSNKFDNTITTNNGGVTYRYTPNKDEMFTVGVNYQNSTLASDRIFPTKTNVNQSFSNVLPSLMWRKKLSNASNIRVFYRTSTNFPSVSQLQDVVNLTNPLRVSTGNPTLKQSFTQFIATRYSYTNSKTGRSFFANLFLQTANNFITNGTFVPTADSTIQNGIVLKQGSQLTKPVNLNGYNSLRSFLTYSLPVKSLKTTVNVNAGFSYSKLPGFANNANIITNNYVYNAGVVLASNISEYVDFNVSYTANFNQTAGYAATANNYVNQALGVQLNLLSKSGWFVQNDVSYQANSGLSEGFNQKYSLWNAAIGKKFLKNKVGELKLSAFDLLKQNQSITRTVDARYIEDAQSVVLQQYFLLTFTYNLKNFGTAAKQATGRNKVGGERMGNAGF